MRRPEIRPRLIQMLQRVKHRHRSAALPCKRRRVQRGAGRRRAIQGPRHARGIERKIEAHHSESAVLQHSQEQAAAATYIQHRPAFAGFPQSPLYETHVIAQHESAIDLLEPAGRGHLRREPVVLRVILLELGWRRLRSQLHQPAALALHHLKLLAGGVVQAIGSGEQKLKLGAVAGWTGAAHRTPLRLGRQAGRPVPHCRIKNLLSMWDRPPGLSRVFQQSLKACPHSSDTTMLGSC